VKLEAVTSMAIPVAGAAGPNEPFGETAYQRLAFEAFTLCESDMLCLFCPRLSNRPISPWR